MQRGKFIGSAPIDLGEGVEIVDTRTKFTGLVKLQPKRKWPATTFNPFVTNHEPYNQDLHCLPSCFSFVCFFVLFCFFAFLFFCLFVFLFVFFVCVFFFFFFLCVFFFFFFFFFFCSFFFC